MQSEDLAQVKAQAQDYLNEFGKLPDNSSVKQAQYKMAGLVQRVSDDIFNKNKEIEHLKEKVRKKEERIKVLKKCLFKAKCTTNTKRRRKPTQ